MGLVILGAYLAAVDFGAPFGVSPLGLAVALAIALRVFSNLLFLSPARRRLILTRNVMTGLISILATALALTLCLAAVLTVDGAEVFRIWCGLQLGVGMFNIWASRDMKLIADEAAAFGMRRADIRAWNLTKALEVAVVVTGTLSLFAVAGEFAALLFISFGVLAVRFLTDWSLVMYFAARRA